MATVDVTYSPATGRQAVTLTSWAGSADLTPALIKASDGPIRTILGLVDALGVQ